jgi:hypothetical protein
MTNYVCIKKIKNSVERIDIEGWDELTKESC